MLRSTLPLLGACLLALSSCGSNSETTTASTTTAAGPATDSAAAMSGDPAGAADSMGAASPAMAGKADPNGPTAPHATDAEFMKTAAHSDQNEMQLSKMALAKGVTGMTKTYAEKMIADHTKSTAALKPIAAKAGVTLPTDMDADHKAMAPMLEKLNGKAFEDKYFAQMVTDHQKTANTMAAHEKMTKNPDLQKFITNTLPVVESHLTMADKDEAKMKM